MCRSVTLHVSWTKESGRSASTKEALCNTPLHQKLLNSQEFENRIQSLRALTRCVVTEPPPFAYQSLRNPCRGICVRRMSSTLCLGSLTVSVLSGGFVYMTSSRGIDVQCVVRYSSRCSLSSASTLPKSPITWRELSLICRLVQLRKVVMIESELSCQCQCK